MKSNNLNVLSPFGPRIAKCKIPKKIINFLNKEVEKITRSKKLFKKLDYSEKLVGKVNQEIKLNQKFINKYLKNFLFRIVSDYVERVVKKKIKKILILNVWVVRQFKNEYNPIHYHDGHISGVGYLKIPKFLNKEKRIHKKKLKTDGTIDFIYGSRNFLNKSIHNHYPKVSDIILFPNYLMHTAYPFSSNGERRSFSFNAKIDETIANVFKHE